MKKTIALIVLLISSLFLALSTVAAPKNWTDDNEQGVQQLFADLKTAYETENINLFLACHAPVIPSTDVTRDIYTLYSEEMVRMELEWLFANFDGVTANFSELQITTERDLAMVRTVRSATIPGFLTAHCDMIFTLQKDGHGWGSQKWRIVNQVLIHEQYEFPGATATAGEAKVTAVAPEEHPLMKSMLY